MVTMNFIYIMKNTDYWQLTFCCFPVYIFSSSLRASRRTRLWRDGIVKVAETFYVRDKLGDVWFFVIETCENHYSFNVQILGYPVKEFKEECLKDAFLRKCCYARIDTQIYKIAENCLVIVDTLVHPKYRNRHIASFMVKEVVEFFENKGVKINKIRGKLGWADETTTENRIARDSFWQSLGFVINKPLRCVEAERTQLTFNKIKAHRITEREYILEVENEFLREIIQQQTQQIENLLWVLNFEETKSCLRKTVDAFLCCVNAVVGVIVSLIKKSK